ncbi:Synaptosomal-associated protein 25 [Orchesella cincta]|uniref:Synaptosomal-associated protein 25 n=1 Tax=Orchesella cincta TaxID=48709 RepID=A0A1D2MXP1_ORCCI|nr:Synaptosomal-associated protein 25 [Orchesella cincta]
MGFTEREEQYAKLHDIKQKTDHVVNESLQSTQRMVKLGAESETMGAKTLNMLDHQREQLNEAEQGMHKINQDVRHTEKHLTGMEKVWGLVSNPFRRSWEFKGDEKIWENSTDGKRVRNKSEQHASTECTNNSKSDEPLIARITNDDREDEMEENMKQVASILANMKNMAIEIGNEIGTSIEQIERIDRMAEVNHDRIKTDTHRMQKI